MNIIDNNSSFLNYINSQKVVSSILKSIKSINLFSPYFDKEKSTEKESTNSFFVFISYSSEDEAPVRLLKQRIEEAFSYEFDVFISCENIPRGKKWPPELYNALKNCKLMILFCSPLSIRNEWIHFEAGCAYIRGIDIITVCHSGLTTKGVPANLQDYQGIDFNEVDSLTVLFDSIKNSLKCKKIPIINSKVVYEELSKEITVASHDYRNISNLFAEALGGLDSNVKLQVQQRINEIYIENLEINTKNVKSLLSGLEYYEGKIDNLVNSEFIDSITRFQKNYNVKPVDGILGRITYQSIQIAYKKYGLDKSNL